VGKAGQDPGVGPLGELLGIRRTEMRDGRCRFELTAGPEHTNPYGLVHGGVVFTLVDYAMGGALTSRLEPGERCASLEVNIHYLLSATPGRLLAEAAVVTRTGRIGVLESRVWGEREQLIALATGAFYIRSAP
jgi:acyl-CoA thioesterase